MVSDMTTNGGGMFGLERGERRVYECKAHGPYEGQPFRMTAIQNAVWRDPECPACNREREEAERARQAARESREEAERQERKLALAGIPPRFRTATFEDYRVEGEKQDYALRAFQKYERKFAQRRREGGGMILVGAPGTGKTHLMCALAIRLLPNWRVRYTDCWTLLSQVKATFRRSSEETEADVIDRYVAPDLLLLDEVGVQYGTDAERALLHRVLDLRYQHVKPTIVSGNVNLEGMAAYLGERAMSRLHEARGTVLDFDWADYRRRKPE